MGFGNIIFSISVSLSCPCRGIRHFLATLKSKKIPVREGIPELITTTSSYQTESTEPVVLEYQAESLDQEIKKGDLK